MGKYYNDLTTGGITSQIIKVSLPIMGTSFIQMAYQITDMFWLGNVGSHAVAAVGTAGFFSWLGGASMASTKIGAEVNVSQSVGLGDGKRGTAFAQNAILLVGVLSLLYGLITFTFAPNLLSFFHLKDQSVIETAVFYLRIISCGMIFNYTNVTFTGIYNGIGKSRISFIINSIGLGINIVLDPILIYHYKLGAVGAGYATVASQLVVFLIFAHFLRNVRPPFEGFKLIGPFIKSFAYKVMKVGLPPAAHYSLFALFTMALARIVSNWGETAIAVQSLGAQIESISWMTATGLSTALSAFVGQNYGAGRVERIKKAYFITLGISCTFGLAATLILYFLGADIYRAFMPEEQAIAIGAQYLKIMAFSQLFMCLEITTSGAFYGLGKSMIPSVVGTIFTGARIPLAIALTGVATLGLDGVWWSVSGTSIVKGILMFGLFMALLLSKRFITLQPQAAE